VARGATIRAELIRVAGRLTRIGSVDQASALSGRVPADSRSLLAHSRKHLVNQRNSVCGKSNYLALRKTNAFSLLKAGL
jgi:hypothetical protein